jgi:hypothetical protein
MDDNLLVSTPAVTAATPWVAVAWLVAAIIALMALALLIRWAKKTFGRPEMHGMSREQVQKRWEEIEKTASTSTLGGKMAIMEADKLLDAALKSMMMSGNTLGERLKFAGYKYPDLRNVWNAHRLRNRIVHEASFEPGRAEVSTAIRDFKRALQTLKLL